MGRVHSKTFLMSILWLPSGIAERLFCEPEADQSCQVEEHGRCIQRSKWESLLLDTRWKFTEGIVGDLCSYHPDLRWRQCSLSSSTSSSALVATTSEGYVAPPVDWLALPPTRRKRKLKGASCATWFQDGVTGDGKRDNVSNELSQQGYMRACDVYLANGCDAQALRRIAQALTIGSVVCAIQPTEILALIHAEAHLISAPFILVTAFHMAMMYPGRPLACPEERCFPSQPFEDIPDKFLEHPMLSIWFSCGLMKRHRKAVGMPIGGDDSTPAFGREWLDTVRRKPKTKLLHAIFCAAHHPLRPRILRRVVEVFGGCGQLMTHVDNKNCSDLHRPIPRHFESVKEGELKWLEELSEYKFVLCPPGTGEDTFRVWQALHVGAFPVVLEAPQFEGFGDMWDDLPVVRLQHIEDLTLERLDQEFEKFSTRSDFNWQKATIAYWVNLIWRERTRMKEQHNTIREDL